MAADFYALGARFGPPLLPTLMMVVDVSPCGRFVTFASREVSSGTVLEATLVREPGRLLTPTRPSRRP